MQYNDRVKHIRREAFKEGVKEGKLKERAKTLMLVQMMIDSVKGLSEARQLIRAWQKEAYRPRAAIRKPSERGGGKQPR
jgi:hypothetical protein